MTITDPAGAISAPAGEKAAAPELTGPDRIPKPSQGWYRDKVTGTKLRRVTTILSQGMPKPALVPWAGNITAETAMNNLPHLVSSSLHPEQRTAAYNWLRLAHSRMKDVRADIGSAVHTVIEADVLGQPIPEELLTNDEIAPYLAHFLRFVEEWEVTFEASEMVVGNYVDGYAGTLDYLLRSRLIAAAISAYLSAGVPEGTVEVPEDAVFVGDTKTGGELDVKGVYPEAGLQMSAYRAAEVGWLRDGTKVPLPDLYPIGVVLHLRPEGYRLIPIACGPDVYAGFLDVKAVAEFQSVTAKSVVGKALSLPTITIEEKAAA